MDDEIRIYAGNELSNFLTVIDIDELLLCKVEPRFPLKDRA